MLNSSPVICLVGTTATGKTDLALKLAEWWLKDSPLAAELMGVDILSADSRQIYQGLEITSGADIPPDFNLIKLASEARPKQTEPLDPSVKIAQRTHWKKNFAVDEYESKPINLWGVACLAPNLSWSAGQFRAFGQSIISGATRNHRALIVVGGTGLYQQILWQKDWQPGVAPDMSLRLDLEEATVSDLQGLLKTRSPERLSALNPSDIANPRRLIRQLELAEKDQLKTSIPAPEKTQDEAQIVLTFGLQRDVASLPELIKARVLKRIDQGARAEINLLDLTTAQPNVLTTLGVKELLLLENNQAKLDEVISLWTTHELQYAKRQITWWKKRPEITWFDTTASNLISEVIKKIQINL